MSQQAPVPGAHGRRAPSFPLAVLEALDDWRKALRHRVAWRARLTPEISPSQRAHVVAMIDRCTFDVARAEQHVRELLRMEAET